MPITLNGSAGITTPSYGGTDTSEYLVPVTAFKNRIINGQMQIDQRNAGASVTPTTSTYVIDRFQNFVLGSATGRYSVQRSSVAPAGFTNSMILTVSTTDASPSSAFGYGISQAIEGFNISDLGWGTANAQAVTVSFWVRSSVTGSYCLNLANNTGALQYTTTYTINSANTWEQKTVTISPPTTGTWESTNSAGLFVVFGLGGGSGRTAASLNSWNVTGGSTLTYASGAVNLLATNGATFYITGVQLEKGSTATSFDYRPYGTELALCQRYYYQSWGSGSGTNSGNAFMSMPIPNSLSNSIGTSSFPVSMRAIPTVTLYDDVFTSGTASQPGLSNNLSANAIIININGFAQASRPSGSFTTGYPIRCHYIANIEL